MEGLKNISIVPIVGGCDYQPHKLYGLWDMIAFLAGGAFSVVEWLEVCKRHMQEQISASGSAALICEADAGLIWRQLKRLKDVCDQVGMSDSKSRAAHLSMRVLPGSPPVECVVIVASIEELVRVVQSELGRKQFALISEDKVKFFEQHDLFGERVSACFPSAQNEIKDAGNCLAADLHTAAVFHFMRAAEHGLRALARHLHVRLSVKLEYACWEEVIRAIDKKLDAIRTKPRGKKKSKDLEFYRRTLDECEMLKDTWRNPVSHVRHTYTEAEALGVCSRVQEFMKRLSERVKECK